MDDFSVLIGGKAGAGIDNSGIIIASIFNRLGYNIYVYRDYPSIIRGGHTFSIIRASKNKIRAHRNQIDFLLALNQDTIDFHNDKLKDSSLIIYDSSSVKSDGIGIDAKKIIEEEKTEDIMRNSILIGAFCKAANISIDILLQTLNKKFTKEKDLNIKVAQKGYNEAQKLTVIKAISSNLKPIITGNDAISLGLINAGLDAYVAYPMTPSSNILHFLADLAEQFNLKVIHPESEIGVIMMALGFVFGGAKTAVGTSGGGFCLMTEK